MLADGQYMYISKTLAASFSLGILTCLSGTAMGMMGDDPRVRVIELPDQDENFTARLAFSDDGSTIVIQQNEITNQRFWVYRDGVWELVLDYTGEDWAGTPRVTGVSADGSVFVITDNNGSLISRDGVFSEVPDLWVDDAGQVVTDGQVYVRSVSGDGQTLGLAGSSPDVYGTDALIWHEAKGLMNLNIGFTGDEAGHHILAMTPDATVIAGSSSMIGRLNNIRDFQGNRESWVLSAQGLTYIPLLDLGYDVVTKVMDVSNDGRAVIGISGGYWRNTQPISPVGIGIEFGPSHSWIWTPEFGTEQIEAPKRYTQVIVLDVSGNGQTVFGYADGPNVSEQFFWTRDGGFIPIWDYLDSRGIENELYFSAQSISDDGSLLMGWGYSDDTATFSAVIIDISE